MLTREGSARRIQRLRDRLEGPWQAILVCHREHVLYFGNFLPLPNSLNLHGAGYLLIERDGPVTLYTDNWLAGDAVAEPPHAQTPADEVESVTWYDCKKPARARVQAVAELTLRALEKKGIRELWSETAYLPWSIGAGLDRVDDLEPTVLEMRELKDPDEIDAIRKGIRTAEAVHEASRELLEPGLTEIEYYARLVERATLAAGVPFVMMGDLASGERAAQGGGGPTSRRIEKGDLVIHDIFPYVEGYRGDITNTLVAGSEPSAEQVDLFETVLDALERAASLLRPGTPASAFNEAIEACFRERAPGDRLVHHAGHAIGLGHPEAPELVESTDRNLQAGMVLTLEPGIYGKATGGLRLEHDYLVTDSGYEQLSKHHLGLI